jgi:SAM-dependent methyltransferase
MKQFYTKFVNSYDLMINWERRLSREWNFVKKYFKERQVKTIIDTACSTGKHAIFFNKKGFEVLGTDVSKEVIEVAKKNVKQAKLEINFKVSNFDNLSQKIKQKFDAATCLGNALANVHSFHALRRSLINFYDILAQKGVLIIQIRNYYRLIDNSGYEYIKPRVFIHDGNEYAILRVADIAGKDRVRLKIFTRVLPSKI